MDENVKTEVIDNVEAGSATEPQPKSFEEQLAELMADNKRMKRALDKATSEAAEYKKQVMATKTEAEKVSMEKAERDAAMKDRLEFLERKDKIREFADSFMDSGYSKDLAIRAAEALYDGKTDEVIATQNQYKSEFEKQLKAKFMKSMPAPATGNDESVQLTQEQFDNMSIAEQTDLYNKHPAVYQKFVN